MSRERYEEISRRGRLASLSLSGQTLRESWRRGERSAASVLEALEADPSVERLVRRFGRLELTDDHAPPSIRSVVSLLGPRAVRDLGLAFSVVLHNRAGICESFDYDSFWSVSIARALGAHRMARELEGARPVDAFLCSLLLGVGALELANAHPEEYARVLDETCGASPSALLALERERFAIDHLQVTREFLRDADFPTQYLDALDSIAGLLRSASAPTEESDPLVTLLWTAQRIADAFYAGEAELPDRWAELVAWGDRFELDRDVLNLLGDTVAMEWGDWGDCLQIPTKPIPALSTLGASGEGGPRERPLPTAEPRRGRAESRRLRILVVDDDRFTLRLLSRQLSLGGHEVETASNGREALDAALAQLPDVVLADWLMPEMDGIELCKALRRFNAGRRIYFMLVTGRDEEDKVIEAFDAGINDFITKPFRPKVLLARIRAGQHVIEVQRQEELQRSLLRDKNAQLRDLERRLRHAALTDVLTGLPNRRYALKRLGQEWANASRTRAPLAVILIDIDHFKRVNDAHGHDVGDEVLRRTATVLRENTRHGEAACRLGGEEFIVICASSDLEDAASCGERLRAAVEAQQIAFGGFEGGVTISVGLAQRDDTVEDVDALLKRADEAVYRAKADGRNLVRVWPLDDARKRAG